MRGPVAVYRGRGRWLRGNDGRQKKKQVRFLKESSRYGAKDSGGAPWKPLKSTNTF